MSDVKEPLPLADLAEALADTHDTQQRCTLAADALEVHGAAALPSVAPLFAAATWVPSAGLQRVTDALSTIGPAALPALLTILPYGNENHQPIVDAIQRTGGEKVLREYLLEGLNNPDRSIAYWYGLPAARSDDTVLLDRLIEMAAEEDAALHDDLPVLAANARPLAERFLSQIVSGTRTDRLVAVRVLKFGHRLLPAEPSASLLLDQLREEPDPDLREALLALLAEFRVSPRRISQALPAVAPNVRVQAIKKVKKLSGTFLDEATLPPLLDAEGEPIPVPMIRYLLHRQSKEPNPQPDVEALDVYDTIDRSTSGDFAIHVLEAALAAKPTKRTAWSFITAGMLGDRRVVAALSAQLPGWIKKNKNALPKFAAAALGLVGDDLALSILVGLADDHREPASEAKRLLRDTAERALAAAAAERGIPREELEEAVLPAFGFRPDGSARVIPAGKRTIEARIGADFKLALTDAASGKRAASVPKAASEEVQAEFRGLRKILAGVFKQQTRRLERLMVDGHAWHGSRWSERFLGHPVLVPFSQRLVWGVLDEAGTGYAALFRGLGDGTLTDAEDAPLERPMADRVAIAHPARMTAEQLAAWTQHATDYEVEQPFEQLHRFTASVPPDLRDALADPRTDGGEVNAFSLRGKLQKYGWTQGDARWTRRFPADGVTAALGVGGNGYDFFYLGPDDAVTTGPLSFERAGEPVPLGGVPPVAYSEAAGLLLRMLGRGP